MTEELYVFSDGFSWIWSESLEPRVPIEEVLGGCSLVAGDGWPKMIWSILRQGHADYDQILAALAQIYFLFPDNLEILRQVEKRVRFKQPQK